MACETTKNNFCHLCCQKISFDEWDIHKRSHGNLDIVACDPCKLIFSKSFQQVEHQNLMNHRSDTDAHGKSESNCFACLESLASPADLTNHLKATHCNLKEEEDDNVAVREFVESCLHGCTFGSGKLSQGGFVCDVCGSLLSSKDALFAHITIRHTFEEILPLSCQGCASSFKTLKLSQDKEACPHLEIKHELPDTFENIPVMCEDFEKHLAEWEDHRRDDRYTCSFCGKTFRQKGKLIVHERTHTNEKPFKCDVCGNSYSNKGNLLQHQRVRHSDSRPYVCSICGKSFAVRVYFRDHMQGHLGAKAHECEVCHKRFRKKSYMKIHERTHTGAQPYKCDICNRPFAQKANLLKHAQLHTDKRSHNCIICKKGFTDSQALKRHMNSHTGYRPFVCSTCGQSYATKGSLNVHMKFHEDTKPHICSVCRKGFFLKAHLKRHMMTHTKVKETKSKPGLRGFTASSAPRLKEEEPVDAGRSMLQSVYVPDENVLVESSEFTCVEEVVFL